MKNREYGFVYLFYPRRGNSPLYIGSTTDPIKRFREHFILSGGKGITKEQRGIVHLIFLACTGDEESCRLTESNLIQTYMPEWNRMFPYPNPLLKGKTKGFFDLDGVYFQKDEFIKDNTIVYRCFSKKKEAI